MSCAPPRARTTLLAAVVLPLSLLVPATLAGCRPPATSDSADIGGSTSAAGPSAGSRGMPLLSPKALPGLAVVTRALPAARLSKDAALPDLAAELVRDGYAGGRERVFEGTSRTLRHATSRALVFHTATGAASFLAYVHRHAQQWFGLTTEVNSLTSAGRTGWMFRPPSCSCPRASPLLVGILGEGAQLTWLAISGPGVTPGMLADLLAPTLSTTA